jgi:1,4-dihydroxy-2-naphthoate octaprenyltransferase
MRLAVFALQLPFQQTSVRMGFSIAYLAIAAAFIYTQGAVRLAYRAWGERCYSPRAPNERCSAAL